MGDWRTHSSTSNWHRVLITNSTTGAPLTGLSIASAGLIISTIADNEAAPVAYTVAAGNVETIATLGTYAAPTSGKCRFREVDATNEPGIYEFQFADARYSVANAQRLLISASGAANMLAMHYEVLLPRMNVMDAVRAGLTALPAALAEALGGLFTRGTGAGQINQVANGMIDANAVRHLGVAYVAPAVAGIPKVDVTYWLGVAPWELIEGRVASLNAIEKPFTVQAASTTSVQVQEDCSATGRNLANGWSNWGASVLVLTGAKKGQLVNTTGDNSATGWATQSPPLYSGTNLDRDFIAGAPAMGDKVVFLACVDKYDLNSRTGDILSAVNTYSGVLITIATAITNKLGAFVGTGTSTVFAWLRALGRKDVATPDDFGGTYAPATDSQEGTFDNLPASVNTVLSAAHGAGAWSATGATGAFTITVTVRDAATLVPIDSAQVTIKDATDANIVDQKRTNPSGVATFSLDAATYKVHVDSVARYSSIAAQTLVVAANAAVIYGLDSTPAPDAYATPADMKRRYDWRLLGDLVRDDNTRATSGELDTDAKLGAILEDASSEIDAAFTQARRYSEDELETLRAAADPRLVRLCVDLAIEMLYARRSGSPPAGVRARIEDARTQLEMIRLGKHVLAVDLARGAGLAEVRTRTAEQRAAQGRIGDTGLLPPDRRPNLP